MPNLPHVSQVIIDRWDRLNPAQQKYFIDYNAKQAAKADAKAADNAAKAAVRVERDDTETRRASFAKRLYKWLDADGKKLPTSEAGIAAHQDMVAEYEREFGIVTTEYPKKYASIRHALAAGRQREEDAEKSRLAAEERKQQQERERDERNAKIRAERDAARDRREAASTIRYYERRAPVYRNLLERLSRNIRADEDRIADLTPKLDSEEYQKARHQRNLLAVLNTVTNRLEGRRKRRDLYQQKLSSAESQIAGAREFLARDAGGE